MQPTDETRDTGIRRGPVHVGPWHAGSVPRRPAVPVESPSSAARMPADDAVPAAQSVPTAPTASAALGSRAFWLAHADALLEAAWSHRNPRRPAELLFSSQPGPLGPEVDGLEGFARVGLLTAFRLAAPEGGGPRAQEYAGYLIDGLRAGTDRQGRGSWYDVANDQLLVEAAGLGVLLRVSRQQVWSRLDRGERHRVLAFLRRALTVTPALNHWVLFPGLVASAILELGGAADVVLDRVRARSFAAVERWYDEPSGWFTDGTGHLFDHYNAFAFHLYPGLDAYLSGDVARMVAARARLQRFLGSYAGWFADDGAPVVFGRSLTHRYAVAACFGVAALLDRALGEVEADRSAAHGRAAAGILAFFRGAAPEAEPGDPERLGWWGPDGYPGLVQPYSGPSSPYWSAKAFVPLLLPPNDPFFADLPAGSAPEPMPEPVVRTAPAGPPGMLVVDSGPGLRELVNHGSDGYRSWYDDHTPELHLYGRLGYSTVTLPEPSERGPVSQGFTVQGRDVRVVRGRIVAAASGADWAGCTATLRASRRSLPRSVAGKSLLGTYERLPVRLRPTGDLPRLRVQTASVVLGRWLVHVVRFAELPVAGRVTFGGWPVAGPDGVGLAPQGRPYRAALIPSYGFEGLAYAEVPGARSGERVRIEYAHTAAVEKGQPVTVVASTWLGPVDAVPGPAPVIHVEGRHVRAGLGGPAIVLDLAATPAATREG